MDRTLLSARFAVLLSLAALVSCLCLADKGPVGIACLNEIDKLPNIYSGLQCCGFSSHDRTGGNNDSGCFLYTVGSEYVMMDVAGPGCIYRIWVTGVGLTNRIRVYLDGETVPRIEKTITDLFAGTAAPFLSPLVGNDTVSSGGYYCYVPIPFRAGCRVTIDNGTCYYNINYQQFSDAAGVTTFTGAEDVSAVVNQWNNCGADPKGIPDARTRTGTVTIPAGSTVQLIDEAGPGSICRIKIGIPRLDTYDETSKSILWNAKLRIYWDNEATPRVDAPIGPMFGSFSPGTTVRSLLFGTTTPSQFYCYFPMPFGSRARVVVFNGSSYAIPSLSYDIGITDMPNAATMLTAQQVGYFAARWREENLVYGGSDFQLGNVTGTGVALGVSLNMVGPGGSVRSYLEGDERIHYDGSLTPAVYGTGTEDFFNGGWYFNRGTFNRPLHGNPTHISSPTDTTACYRIFLGDRFHFKSAFKPGLEHGPVNDISGKYSCVAYGYEAGEATLTQTDALDIGDAASELAHSYAIVGQKWSGQKSMYYEGDDDGTLISDGGRTFGGSSQFTVAVDPTNGGVLLRRRMDYSTSDQRAQVYVDGALVGTWYTAGANVSKSWRDSDFMIPSAFTAGKSAITVKLVYVSGNWFSEFRYWIFSVQDTSVSPGTIVGTVSAAGGGGIAGATVTATPRDYTTATDDYGRYTLSGVYAGSYSVKVTKFGYAPQSKPATVASGGSVTVDFALCPAVLVSSPSAARSVPDGTFARIDDLIVTAVFSSLGRFYAERADRSGGIGVEALGVAVGDRVNVSGEAATVDGERVLRNGVIEVISHGATVPDACTMPHRSIGGGGDGFQGAVIDNAAAGKYASGGNNIGLLVNVWGTVTYSNPALGVFYVDDGSAIADGSGRVGLKVLASGLPVPSVGKRVGVTGISSATMVGGRVARLIRPRTILDIIYPAGDNLLANPGFETGDHTGWTLIGSGPYPVCQSWFVGITPHGGTCFEGLCTIGSPSTAYLYQRVPATVGQSYLVSGWSLVYWANNDPAAARNRIGIDPYGNTGSPGTGVVWSPYDVQQSPSTWQWRQLWTGAAAASNYVTIYVELNQQYATGWHINCFDDVDCHGI